jgi:hypothetical protein
MEARGYVIMLPVASPKLPIQNLTTNNNKAQTPITIEHDNDTP